MKQKEWSWKELDILRREFPNKTTAELSKVLKRSCGSISNKANELGLKKKHYGIVWTPQMLKILTNFFPRMFNKPLANWLQVSQRTMIRKARELGLEKKEGFLEIRRKDIGRLVSASLKNSPDPKGTRFKKGEHRCPEKEFKKGHKESAESRQKRSEAMKEVWARRKKAKIRLY